MSICTIGTIHSVKYAELWQREVIQKKTLLKSGTEDMSDKEFIDSIMEMFDVHEGNEYYTDEEFIRAVRHLIFEYQIYNNV